MDWRVPRGATWQLLGSSAASKPTKQRSGTGEGVRMILGGTCVRNGWPLAMKFEDFKVIESSGEVLPPLSKVGVIGGGFFVRLGGAIRA